MGSERYLGLPVTVLNGFSILARKASGPPLSLCAYQRPWVGLNKLTGCLGFGGSPIDPLGHNTV